MSTPGPCWAQGPPQVLGPSGLPKPQCDVYSPWSPCASGSRNRIRSHSVLRGHTSPEPLYGGSVAEEPVLEDRPLGVRVVGCILCGEGRSEALVRVAPPLHECAHWYIAALTSATPCPALGWGGGGAHAPPPLPPGTRASSERLSTGHRHYSASVGLKSADKTSARATPQVRDWGSPPATHGAGGGGLGVFLL